MDLEVLRLQLAAIDQVLAWVARRQALATQVGEAKRRAGRPTRDYDQERDVVQRARATAAELGTPPELAEQWTLLLIRSSLMARSRSRCDAAAAGAARAIGGAGKIRPPDGALPAQGFAVEIADPAAAVAGFAHHADWHALALDHDLIVVAAPLRVTNDILHALAEHAARAAWCSTSARRRARCARGWRVLAVAGVDVTSVDPMFGPDTSGATSSSWTSARQRRAPRRAAVDHGDVQGPREPRSPHRLHPRALACALNIAFFTALAESGEAAPDLARLSSTTFDAQLAVAARVAEENPHRYFEIQSLNDYGTGRERRAAARGGTAAPWWRAGGFAVLRGSRCLPRGLGRPSGALTGARGRAAVSPGRGRRAQRLARARASASTHASASALSTRPASQLWFSGSRRRGSRAEPGDVRGVPVLGEARGQPGAGGEQPRAQRPRARRREPVAEPPPRPAARRRARRSRPRRRR